jgi:type IX secretion system PorP/SprF family membrane protein
MRKKFYALLTLITLITGGLTYKANAQDPQFTQFYANPLYLNPAFAGSLRCPRVCLNFRDEWPALAGNFVTYSASFDRYVDALSGGIGILVEQDQAGQGALTTTNISGIYSYHMNVNRYFAINAGLQATYHQKSIDQGKLTFGDQIDPENGFVYNTSEILSRTSVGVPDFSAGILGYSKNLFFGFAADHLSQPDESFVSAPSPLPMKFTAHVGAMLDVNSHSTLTEDQFTISPNILYQQQADFHQLDLGFYAIKGSIVGGVWYRNQDAIMVLIGIDRKQFKFGYSYDITISRLTEATAGSHEISLIFDFQCRPKRHTYRVVNCPSF